MLLERTKMSEGLKQYWVVHLELGGILEILFYQFHHRTNWGQPTASRQGPEFRLPHFCFSVCLTLSYKMNYTKKHAILNTGLQKTSVA